MAKLTVILLLVIAVVGVIIFKTLFSVESASRTYYAVCFYSGQSKAQAESVRDDLIASGGSGYMISGGEYKVYGSVYIDKSEADNVADKEENAFVEILGWDNFEMSFVSPSEAKQAGEALEYFCSVCDAFVKSSLSVAKQEESKLTAYTFAMDASQRLSRYALSVEDEKLSDFFTKAAYSAQNITDAEDENFLASFRYAAQDLIMLRSAVTA